MKIKRKKYLHTRYLYKRKLSNKVLISTWPTLINIAMYRGYRNVVFNEDIADARHWQGKETRKRS